MLNRNTVLAISLTVAGGFVPAFADDGDVERARILLEEARQFGQPEVRGAAAGEVVAEREARRNQNTRNDEHERHWVRIHEQAANGQ